MADMTQHLFLCPDLSRRYHTSGLTDKSFVAVLYCISRLLGMSDICHTLRWTADPADYDQCS